MNGNPFKVDYRYHSTTYHIEVRRISQNSETTVIEDGTERMDGIIRLEDDLKEHYVTVEQKNAVVVTQ